MFYREQKPICSRLEEKAAERGGTKKEGDKTRRNGRVQKKAASLVGSSLGQMKKCLLKALLRLKG